MILIIIHIQLDKINYINYNIYERLQYMIDTIYDIEF